MTDYSNPKVMKSVMKEAKNAGIFAKGIDKKKIRDVYVLKINKDDAMTLDMFKDNPKYSYKLVQIDYIGGMCSQIKSNKLKIKEMDKGLFSFYYKLEIEQIKDKSRRAWDEIDGKPLVFYFQNKEGFIDTIIPKSAWLDTKDKLNAQEGKQ